MSIANPGVKWVCTSSYACSEVVQGQSLPSLTGGMIPGPNCEHTHLPSRSNVPLFRTNRYIKHSVTRGKVWGETLGWDKVGQQLVYFVLYLYFSLTLCLCPTPSSLERLKSLFMWTDAKSYHRFLPCESSPECSVEGSWDDKLRSWLSLVAGWIQPLQPPFSWSVKHTVTKAAIHLRLVEKKKWKHRASFVLEQKQDKARARGERIHLIWSQLAAHAYPCRQ